MATYGKPGSVCARQKKEGMDGIQLLPEKRLIESTVLPSHSLAQQRSEIMLTVALGFVFGRSSRT